MSNTTLLIVPKEIFATLPEILLNLEIQFQKNLSAQEVALAVDRLEEKIRNQLSDIKLIFIEAKSLSRNCAKRSACSDRNSITKLDSTKTESD